jgi:sec-independent protein translocase protein TatA
MIGDLFDSPWKILIVAVVLIVLFGSKKLPDAARSLGRSMRILKAEVQDLHHDHDTETPEAAPPTPAITASQQQIDQLQEQIRNLQQQQQSAAGQAVTVNGSAATETPQTQQPS